jgi:uracil-DNA glycosylase family 4
MGRVTCTLCPLHKTAKSVCVQREEVGADPKVLVIGEAPGREEDQRNRPFVGRSGRLLRESLQKAGIHQYILTNLVKCRPPDNRAPTRQEIKACSIHLQAELAEIHPDFIVTAGGPASKAVVKQSKITEAHGKLVSMAAGVQGYPILHPAYVLRDPSKQAIFDHDLERLSRIMRGEKRGILPRWEVVTADNWKEFLAEFRVADAFSFDLETSGLFPYDRRGFIRCVGIGLPSRSWVIRGEMPGSPFQGKPELLASMVRKLAEEQRRTGKIGVAQNGKFDNKWLEIYCGIGFKLDFDTMLAHYVIDENQPHDLKYLARAYLDAPEYDLTTKEKQGNVAPEKLYEYNGLDCGYTLRLYTIFDRVFKRDPRLRRLFYRLMMPASRAMQVIEMEGLYLNMPKYAETEIKVTKDRDAMLGELNKLAVKYGQPVNWNAPAQVAKLFYERLKLKCTVRTAKGAPSTGEAALADLRGQHEVVDQLIKFRELEKFLGTYIRGWKEYIVENRLFMDYKLHGTVTGRYSSRLHQVPRDGTIRNLVEAPPGWRFVQADLSQAELRIAAELSRDVELVACFQPGGEDVHWRTLLFMIESGRAEFYTKPALMTASKLRPFRVGQISDAVEILRKAGHDAAIGVWKDWKEGRKKAKAINFGFVFGMFENKFIEQAKTKYGWDCTWEEAHSMRQAYFELYQGVPRWHDRQKALLKVNGYVTNLFGRVRRLPGVFSQDRELRGEAERQAINSPVQGTIGDWKAAAMVEIHETIDRQALRIVGEHHDALLMIVREGAEAETLPRVRNIMRRPKLLDDFKIRMSVPMESEIEIGPWGAGKKWEQKCLTK